SETEQETGGGETGHCSDERMPDGGKTPDREHHGKADACSNTIDKSSCQQEADRICRLEGSDDPAILDFIPADDALQFGSEYADDLAIDVVDRRGKEKKRADVPAIVAGPNRFDRRRSCYCGFHWSLPRRNDPAENRSASFWDS